MSLNCLWAIKIQSIIHLFSCLASKASVLQAERLLIFYGHVPEFGVDTSARMSADQVVTSLKILWKWSFFSQPHRGTAQLWIQSLVSIEAPLKVKSS